jgi:dTDP-4-dehydrorhamnose reductase
VKSLVIGASGQVGHHLFGALVRKGQSAVGTCNTHPEPGLVPLDLRDRDSVLSLVSHVAPEVVFLAASCANVDYCELNPEPTYRINVEGAKHVTDAVRRVGARLVFFSSDYVFDGSAGPYSEDEPASPISEYGKQKLIGEHLVALHVEDHLIVRTTVVYGWEPQAKNFVQRLLRSLRERNRIQVPGDQLGTPTYAPNLAEAVVELARLPIKGVVNVAGPTLASRYEFAVSVAQAFRLDPTLIEKVPTALLQQPARRPLRGGLQVAKAAALLHTRLMGYEEALNAMAAQPPDTSPARMATNE